MLRLWLKFSEVDGKKIIDRASFQSFGCQTALAVASMATEMLKGKSVEEARNLTAAELKSISQTSCGVLSKMGPQIQWLQSYVTADKVYCVYIAPDEATVRDIVLGPADGIMQSVTKGLEGGENVIVEGVDRLREGRAVSVVSDDPAKAAHSPGGEGAAKGDGAKKKKKKES